MENNQEFVEHTADGPALRVYDFFAGNYTTIGCDMITSILQLFKHRPAYVVPRVLSLSGHPSIRFL